MNSIRPRVTWFSPDTRGKIIEEATSVLEKLGVVVDNDAALAVLDGAGARIDKPQRRARIPAGCVERALRTVPHRVLVYDRRGKAAMDLGEDRLHFNPGSAALRIFDAQTGDARTPVTQDLMRFARLVDALPNYAAQSTGLIASDVPPEVADRYRLYVTLLYTEKPVVTGTFRVDGFGPMHEMLCAVAGGPERLRERPTAIFDCCPSPPLSWSNLTCQLLMDCATAGLPAELVSMPLTGSTAPVTLAGAVVQHCAESLSGIVIHQLVAPGAPIIYGGSPACFDMRYGTAPMGAVETMMIDGAYAEIGKHLGLPTHAYMALSDAKPVDYQAGMETAAGAVIAALSGINNVSGPGMLDFESCQSLEKLVLDHELSGMALRLARGIALKDEPIALPVLEQGVRAREFLSLPHTREWHREEVYLPSDVIDRRSLEEWRKNGRQDAFRRAAARVEKTLQIHHPEPLSGSTVRELQQIMLAEARRHGMDRLPDAGSIHECGR
jgi:trimethylamine--corrinoid protein Co-methyltransferase